MPSMENPPGANRGAMTQPGGQLVSPQGRALPRTFAEAAAYDTPDEVRAHPVYFVGYSDGTFDTLALVGVDPDPIVAVSNGEVSTHDPLVRAVVHRRRDELARRRDYSSKPAPQTAAQLMARARHSWARIERQIAAGQVVA